MGIVLIVCVCMLIAFIVDNIISNIKAGRNTWRQILSSIANDKYVLVMTYITLIANVFAILVRR